MRRLIVLVCKPAVAPTRRAGTRARESCRSLLYGTTGLTEAGADEQVESQVAAVLDAVRDVRPGLPEFGLRLACPAVCSRPASPAGCNDDVSFRCKLAFRQTSCGP